MARGTGSSRTATPRSCSRPTTTGATVRRPPQGHVRLRDRRTRQRPGAAGPRPAGHQTAVRAEDAHRIRFASSLPALLAGGGVDTRIDPSPCTTTCHFHSVVPPPHTILRGRAQAAAGTLVAIEPDGRAMRPRPIGTRLSPARRARRLVRAGLAGRGARALRLAVQRRLVADVPVGRAAVGRPGLQPDRRPAGRGGPAGLATFSIGFESVGGVEGDEFRYSDIIADAVRHRPPPDPHRQRRACCPRSTVRSAP